MRPLMVINVVGLTSRLLGPDTPRLNGIAAGGFCAPMTTVLPAVTCSAQATMTTGSLPREHGIVGNGWFFRDLGEVWLWRQSARLVSGEPVWEAARRLDPSCTCAHLFWWYAMGVRSQWVATPRPVYWTDGRKDPDIYTRPPELRVELQRELGQFPLFRFWGPGAGLPSSQWIARAAARVFEEHRPTLTLVYLPHLDYDLQRHGPRWEGLGAQLRSVDALVGDLADLVRGAGGEVLVVSEYGVTEVSRGVHLNRALREGGYLEVTANAAGELLDPLASRAFAVADHQVAHVYVRDPADQPAVQQLLESLDGVDQVLDRGGQARVGLDHARSGELVVVAAAGCWFTYHYWLHEGRAPDFARCVEIHRKPGYDPAELFLDPELPLGRLGVALRLLRRRLGLRMRMDVVPLDDTLVRGSHGRLPEDPADGPVFISSRPGEAPDQVEITSVKGRILAALQERDWP